MEKEITKVLHKLQAYKTNPDLVKEPSVAEMASLVVLVLDQVKVIEKAIKDGRLDGYTPQPGKDYESRKDTLDAIKKFTLEAKNELKQELEASKKELGSKLDTSEQGLNKAIQNAIANIKNGEDGVVTDAEIARAAELARELIELPDFDALIAEKTTANPASIRDGLELLEGDERLKQSAIQNLPEDLQKLDSRIAETQASVGTAKHVVRKVVTDMSNAGEIGGDSLPDQSGNNGKFLTTDGTDASWATLAGGGDMAAATYDPAAKSEQLLGISDILDEDNMASDSATKVPSQQSVKAYVDNNVASGALAALDTVDTAQIDDDAVTIGKIADAAIVTEAEGIGSNDNDTTLPTSAAVKDYVDTNAGSVSDTAYGIGWNGETGTAPSKNAVYDKVEALDTAKQDVLSEGAFADGDKTKLDGIETAADVTANATVDGGSY